MRDAADLRPSPDLTNLSLPALTREIDLRRRPGRILRLLMNALERGRQAKGLGWSRPWNKDGLTIFRTHITDLRRDREHYGPLAGLLAALRPHIPDYWFTFANELLADPAGMSFVFYHNHEQAAVQHEGLTLSFGRRCEGDRSKRDRVDLILEDRRNAGRVDGLVDRLRVHICPWSRYRRDREHFALALNRFNPGESGAILPLYREAVRHYHLWKDQEERQWRHWSQQYIDYFGARTFIPVGTSFS